MVIVEGQVDALTFDQCHIPAITIRVIQVSGELLVRLKQNNRIFIARDNTYQGKWGIYR